MSRTYLVEFLFDYGAKHSFISTRLRIVSTSKYSLLSIAHPDGKMVNCQDLYIDWHILIHGHDILVDLYKFEVIESNIILGMDWLYKHQAHINCPKRMVT